MSNSLWSHGLWLQGSSAHRISQARILKWVAIFFSRGSSPPRDQMHISCIGRQILYQWGCWESLKVPYIRELKHDHVQTMAETQISPKEQLMKLSDLQVMVILELHAGASLSQYEQKKTQASWIVHFKTRVSLYPITCLLKVIKESLKIIINKSQCLIINIKFGKAFKIVILYIHKTLQYFDTSFCFLGC